MSAPLTMVAFIDDDDDLRAASTQSLELAGLEVLPFPNGPKALATIDRDFSGVVVTDIRMPLMDGRQVFRRLHQIDPDLPVIFITGHSDISEAVDAMHEGAYDFIPKPFKADRLLHAVRRGLEKRQLILANRRLHALAGEAQAGWPIVGQSQAIENLRASLRQIAQADVDTLIEGETGVGKELVARALHSWGPRRLRPFVAVNCGALPAELVESELFGHEIGAFPGAARSRIGRIESADRGTLFLDDIEAMPEQVQVKLLRFLAEREFSRLGSNDVHTVDVRVVTSAKSNLAGSGAESGIRPDLFHRLNVARIHVPALRERREDIPLLFAHFSSLAAARFKREQPMVDEQVQRRLLDHDWPGNVRELSNFAEQFVLGLASNLASPAEETESTSLKDRVERYEADVIRQTLAAHEGNVSKVIQTLQIPRKTLYDKMSRHGVEPERFRPRASK